jgi:hypothetical protein
MVMNTSTILLNVVGMVVLTIVVAAAMIGVPLFCDGIPRSRARRAPRDGQAASSRSAAVRADPPRRQPSAQS